MPITNNETYICQICGKNINKLYSPINVFKTDQIPKKHHVCSKECYKIWSKSMTSPGSISNFFADFLDGEYTCQICGKKVNKLFCNCSNMKPDQPIFKYHVCSKTCYNEWGKIPNCVNGSISNFCRNQTCDICGKELSVIWKHSFYKNGIYCSEKCFKNKSSNTIKKGLPKRKQTNLEKYGFDHAMKNKNIRKKAITTCIEIYGVENPMQLEEFREKYRKTCMENFGSEYPVQSEEILKKTKKTCLEKYGIEYACQADVVREKSKQTLLKNFGVDSPFKSEKVQAKKKATCMERYGVENYIQTPEMQDRLKFKRKKWIAPDGSIHKIQGYENLALGLLINRGYKFPEDIFVDYKTKPYIEYIFNGGKHRYFPDIWIPKDNMIVEVKSYYTLLSELDKNVSKFNATCKKYNFLLLVYNKKEELIIEELRKI